MANADSITYTDTLGNYLGPFFLLGANQTPCLGMIGGLNGAKPVVGFDFPVTQYSSLDAASQDVSAEDDAVAGTATPRTYDRDQAINYIQIMYKNIEVSYAKMSDRLKLSGLAYASPAELIQAELDFQTNMNLRQLAINMEYSIFQGVGVQKTAASTHSKTKGFVGTGANGFVSTNKVNAGTAALTTALINQLVRTMAGNGAPFANPVLWVNAWQKQKISDLYGWSPVAAPGTGLGGTAVQVIETDFARIPVMFDPFMLASAVVIAEMSELTIAGLPVPGKGAIFVEPKSKTGASEKYQLYAQLGLDFGEESHHGSIYGLTTS